MEQWAKEAKTKTVPGRLKVTTHHGPHRTRGKCLSKAIVMTWLILDSEPSKLEKFDIVVSSDRQYCRQIREVLCFATQITTFQTLASEHGAKTSFAASRSSDKNGDLSSNEEDSDGDRFGKPVKKPVKKTAKKVGGASALFGVKWLRIVIGQ